MCTYFVYYVIKILKIQFPFVMIKNCMLLALLLVFKISFSQIYKPGNLTFGNKLFLDNELIADNVQQDIFTDKQNKASNPDRTAHDKLVQNEMASYRLKFGLTVPGTGTEYDAKYYRLELRINPDTSIGKYIKGKITTYFTTVQPNFSVVNFDFATPLNCDSVYYHGVKIATGNITRPVDLLQITIPSIVSPGTLDSIAVYYQGVPPVVPYFGNGTGYVNATHNGTQNFTYTLSEPYSSYTWWPCKSFIVNDKADSMDMIVSTPTGFKTAGNGTLVSETTTGSNIITYWKERYPISAYQICTAVANYLQYPAVADTVIIGGTKMPVYNYLFPETNTAAAHISLDRVKLMLTTFSSKFGDYPFKNEKYGNYTFGFGGGMEHNTFSGESAYGVYDNASDWYILAHELGHQWFGANVTNGSWAEIWINESFATFAESICVEFDPAISAAVGVTGADWRAYHKSYAINPGYQYQSVYVNDTSNMATIFTPAVFVYERGAMVLYMLRTLLGDTKFFQAIKNYETDPLLKYGNAVTADVKRHMEAVSGLNLATFFNQWIYNTGFAKYNVGWNNAGTNLFLQLTQTTQSSALSHFDMPVPLRIQGSNPVTMDTTIIVYDQGGILSYNQDGVLTSSGNDKVQFNLSFVPTTITFDAFSQVLASGTVTKNTLLATNIIDFAGINEGNKVKLWWSVNSSYDCTRFEVERSADGITFDKIGLINTGGNNNINSFSFIDNNVLKEKNYYRLKIFQQDGSFVYTSVIIISTKVNAGLYTVSPNPASDYFIIKCNGNKGKVNIEIYDAAGSEVKKLLSQSFFNNNIKIDVHDFKPGNYFIKIQSEVSGTYTKQIVITK
jgi:hypothetical protein